MGRADRLRGDGIACQGSGRVGITQACFAGWEGLQEPRRTPFYRCNMLTMYLTESETVGYKGLIRASVKRLARSTARKMGKRFAQIVGSDGRILDVVEVG